MRSRSQTLARLAAGALLALLALAAGAAEAPPAEAVSRAVSHYHRVTPRVATAGLLGPGGIEEARRLGFVQIIDLRTPAEGSAAEGAAAARAGLGYLDIPVSTLAPTPAQVAAFARAIEGASGTVLVHCHSASRAGAMWALYQASRGQTLEEAVAEGRAAGLKPNREGAVRALIGGAPGGDVTRLTAPPSGGEGPAEDLDGEDVNPFDRNDGDDMGC